MDILITIIIGGIIGWLASLLMKTSGQMGILANIGVGIVGGFLGGLLGPMLGLTPQGGIGHFLIALGGAVLLIWILKALNVLR